MSDEQEYSSFTTKGSGSKYHPIYLKPDSGRCDKRYYW